MKFLRFIYKVSALQTASYKRLRKHMSHWYMQCILRSLIRTVLKPTLISSDSIKITCVQAVASSVMVQILHARKCKVNLRLDRS